MASSSIRDYIVFYLNGEKITVRDQNIFMTLAEYLRYAKGCTGTKIVCAEGDCGACSVLMSDPKTLLEGKLNYVPVNSCIQYLYLLDGTSIVTIEGLKSEDAFHPIQEAMVKHHGAQCGYCTPGIVCTLAGLFENKDDVSKKNVQNALTGNLCRCTGYDPIISAALDVNTANYEKLNKRYGQKELIDDLLKQRNTPIEITINGNTLYSPTSLESFSTIRDQHKDATIVSGATDLGVVTNKGRKEIKQSISLNLIDELYYIENTDTHIVVGAKVSLSKLQKHIEKEQPEFSNLLNIFASPQIKNTGTLIGNVANGSPIGDTLPFLFVAEALIETHGPDGERTININEFYKGYRTLDLKQNEIITAIRIPHKDKNKVLKLYKVSKRKDLDISAFTAAILIEKDKSHISSAKIAYGGVAATVLRMKSIEEELTDKPFKLETFKQAAKLVRKEITPLSDVRGSQEFRYKLAENILEKFYHETKES